MNKEELKEMITNPSRWPNWPALPFKRTTNGSMEIAYLFGDPQEPVDLYGGNIWTISENDPVLQTYTTIDDLIADGWTVD